MVQFHKGVANKLAFILDSHLLLDLENTCFNCQGLAPPPAAQPLVITINHFTWAQPGLNLELLSFCTSLCSPPPSRFPATFLTHTFIFLDYKRCSFPFGAFASDLPVCHVFDLCFNFLDLWIQLIALSVLLSQISWPPTIPVLGKSYPLLLQITVPWVSSLHTGFLSLTMICLIFVLISLIFPTTWNNGNVKCLFA